MITVQPAILESDVSAIQNRLDAVRDLCDEVHLDVMDGDFVPNTTFSDPAAIAQLNWGKLRVSLHLMIRNPELYIRRWAFPAVSSFVIHREAMNNVADCIQLVRNVDKGMAIAVNPHTTSYEVLEYLDDIDFLMVMCVEPGFSAQAFNSDVLDKIKYIHGLKPKLPIAVDGGINLRTKVPVVAAGASILCANSYLFKADNLQDAYNLLKQ